MKDYFIKLFNYDQYANLKIAETLLAAGNPQKPLQLMAHLLTAEIVWLRRCKGESTADLILWPTWQAGDLKQVINDTHNAWIAYLNGLNEVDFDKEMYYTNSAGQGFTNTVADTLAHAINHGTHTRAQAGQHLKLAGIETLPPTDYIYYIRTL